MISNIAFIPTNSGRALLGHFSLRRSRRPATIIAGGLSMNIETFPTETLRPAYRPVLREPTFERIGTAWELRLVAEAYGLLAPGRLIVSDGLAFLVDRLLHGADIDAYVWVLDEESDHSDVFLIDHLLADLCDGCELLADAIAEDQLSARPRILASVSGLALKTCRRIRSLT
jgi:hypothetical protein